MFQPWTEFSAYLFGFWLADGHISLRQKHGKLRKYFGAGSTDKQIIESICNIIERNYYTEPPRGKGKKPYYKFEMRHDEAFDFCLRQVGTINKSDEPINFPFVPDDFLPHQTRGYFDGDGSIYWARYRNRHGRQGSQLRSSFTAGNHTGDLLNDLMYKLNIVIGTPIKKLTGKKHKKLVYSQYDTYKLCSWMYNNHQICLLRKKQIWDEADKAKLASSLQYSHN